MQWIDIRTVEPLLHNNTAFKGVPPFKDNILKSKITRAFLVLKYCCLTAPALTMICFFRSIIWALYIIIPLIKVNYGIW